MKRLKICLVSHDYRPNVGGIAAHVEGLALGLAKAGHQVWLIAPGQSCPSDELLPYTTIRLQVPNLRKARGVTFAFRGLVALWKLERTQQLDVIHWHNFLPDSLIGRWFRRPVRVFTNHSSGFLELYKKNEQQGLLKWLVHGVDRIIGPSHELAQKSVYTGVSPERCIYVPNGVDPGRFTPTPPDQDLRNRLGLPTGVPVILCPRRLDPKNGVRYLMEAIPILVARGYEFRVLVAGGGFEEERRSLEDYLRQHQVLTYVQFAGTVPAEHMPSYVSLGDIGVLPSLMEATSIAALECMACEKPLVTTNVGGLPEIVEDGVNGFLVPPRDPIALADALGRLLDTPNSWAPMGAAGRKVVLKNYSWSSIAMKTAEMYTEVSRRA